MVPTHQHHKKKWGKSGIQTWTQTLTHYNTLGLEASCGALIY